MAKTLEIVEVTAYVADEEIDTVKLQIMERRKA